MFSFNELALLWLVMRELVEDLLPGGVMESSFRRARQSVMGLNRTYWLNAGIFLGLLLPAFATTVILGKQ